MQLFVIAPAYWNLIFNMCKPFLSEDTKKKIVILGGSFFYMWFLIYYYFIYYYYIFVNHENADKISCEILCLNIYYPNKVNCFVNVFQLTGKRSC